ncbi:DoxX family protein [Sphingobium lignivorans]|uniref:Membrane protein YphA (DoxX/SURF4 family) n=1 Tax=Sphingobium lignivorans TaxID=2735886 RepID=A0ABR6NBQ7_9SPHN|nr:DoxX family protein [Sphingobium lignivorans]MBB5984716.1 putative membrane protein YphA (DoxX/SURF4 family) [Sphingobium lignivorans]
MNRRWWMSPGEATWSILVRLSLAGVFIPEGLQKLVHPDVLGAGRFARIGIPYPDFFGPFVGWVELVAGMLFLLGYATRIAAVPIIIIMIVAIVSTKIPILLGREWGGFSLRELDSYGFLSFTHETRTDWAMLLGALYLLLAGGGRWSLDARAGKRRGRSTRR